MQFKTLAVSGLFGLVLALSGCVNQANESDEVNYFSDAELSVELAQGSGDGAVVTAPPTGQGTLEIQISVRDLELQSSTRATLEVLSATVLGTTPEKPAIVDLVKSEGDAIHRGRFLLSYTSPGRVTLRVRVFDLVEVVTFTIRSPTTPDFDLAWANVDLWKSYDGESDEEQVLQPTICSSTALERTAAWTATSPAILENSRERFSEEGDSEYCSAATLYIPANLSDNSAVPITVSATVEDETRRRVISPCEADCGG